MTPATTRQRLLEAALDRCRTVGPAATTISAVAARAGVTRLTVYRQLGDQAGLLEACREAIEATAPLPDPGSWAAEVDPVERILAALPELWRAYADDSALVANVLRDETHGPAMARLAEPYRTLVERAVPVLAEGWTDDPAREPVVRAAIRLALSFATWQRLVPEGGLDGADALDVLVGMIEAAAEPLP